MQWWKEYQKYFPILAIIAKQILVTSILIVAMEQKFSIGRNILDQIRFSLSLDSIQTQTCLDDWIKAQYQKQKINQKRNYDFLEMIKTRERRIATTS